MATVIRSQPNRASLGCGGSSFIPWMKLDNISKECFQHLVESMPRRIKADLKAKGGQTQY